MARADGMTAARLRALYPAPTGRAAVKVLDHLDKHCCRFLENSPFAILATTTGTELDISPKGDPYGFVVIEDETHILLPDRPGNNRLDGMLNILENPAVALLFLIPGVNESLRVNGTAEILEDDVLREMCSVNGKEPLTVIRVTVQEAFIHCGKAMMRSGLWRGESWPQERPIATLGQMTADQSGDADSPIESEAAMLQRYRRVLY
ncbi:MAG TPA: pyridoxamine 5'-phosphate oxidase family protein [Paracoccaceae bacterium]|nr:pyridoxamine 5'-phosphate oxidase family protein [Paracoccaceae bacterium]